MNKKQERLNGLLNYINVKGRISIRELAVIFDVTELTIRRDIQILEQKGQVQNVRGIVFSGEMNRENSMYSLSVESTKNFKEKNAIGLYAAKMIEDNDIVMIDNGTTTERLAAHFPEDINATVFCYNINILFNLYKKTNISLIFGGGYYHSETTMFESKESLELIRRIRGTKVFVSAAGVHDHLGVTCTGTYELESKREILKASMKKILLVDSSKFGRVHENYVCEYDIFDIIITDKMIPEEWKTRITEAGVECITV